jgi:hypothetical protein
MRIGFDSSSISLLGVGEFRLTEENVPEQRQRPRVVRVGLNKQLGLPAGGIDMAGLEQAPEQRDGWHCRRKEVRVVGYSVPTCEQGDACICNRKPYQHGSKP